MPLLYTFLGALFVALTCLAAIFATERAASRITGPLGWGLAVLLSIAAVLMLCQSLGAAEAVAVTTAGLMFAIPLVATTVAWLQRQGKGR